MVNLDIELKSLNDFMNSVRQNQGDKIIMYKQQIEDNKIVIKRQDKLIVDLQQRNELSQNAVVVTQDQVTAQNKEKDLLQIKMAELNDQRTYFHGSISSLKERIDTFRSYLQSQNQLAALARQKEREEHLSIPEEQPKTKSRGSRKVRDSQSNMDNRSQKSVMSKQSRSSSPLKSNFKSR